MQKKHCTSDLVQSKHLRKLISKQLPVEISLKLLPIHHGLSNKNKHLAWLGLGSLSWEQPKREVEKGCIDIQAGRH